ncbi:MAG: GntR family transcriptional regulator [Desulfovibrio sp.]|jgi:DNA-binding GntR family transcriptional regulator|nr:GntR family transcriptional regulator [Desulfovibrio sp.]
MRQVELKQRSRSDDVVDYLIDAILRGDFKPGDKIRELHTARMLDVSQATVRQALRELRARGLLLSRPFKGSCVRPFTEQGLRGYFRVRTELEVLAARWILEAAAEGESERPGWSGLRACIGSMAGHIRRKDHAAYRKADMRFHRLLVEASGNDALLAAWDALGHSFWAYFGLYFEQRLDDLSRQIGMHEAIVENLESGDIRDFGKKLRSHYVDVSGLAGGQERYVTACPEQAGETHSDWR